MFVLICDQQMSHTRMPDGFCVSHGVDINSWNLFGAVLAWHVAQLVYSAHARCLLLSQEQEQHTCKKYGAPVYTNTIYKDEYGWKVDCVLTHQIRFDQNVCPGRKPLKCCFYTYVCTHFGSLRLI